MDQTGEWIGVWWLLTISGVEVVDVGITEGTAGDGITTDTNAVEMLAGEVSDSRRDRQLVTNLATGPIMLKISKSIASVTVGSSSPT